MYGKYINIWNLKKYEGGIYMKVHGIYGIIKIAVALTVDFMLVEYFLGIELALLVTSGIMLCAYCWEYIAVLRDGAISMNKLNDQEKSKLLRVKECLKQDVLRVSGVDISRWKFYVVPSDTINAYAYGVNHISVTRGALTCCDDMTLCSVLAHEVSHSLNQDSIYKRVILANLTIAIMVVTILSVVSTSCWWLIFIILTLMGVCGGVVSILIFHGITNLFKCIFTVCKRFILFFCQIAMSIVSRNCELRSDQYSCQLGYGPELSRFLSRFVNNQEENGWNNILYATHPETTKRISRIEQYRVVIEDI